MSNSDRWLSFSYLASKVVLKGQLINNYVSSIQIAIQPSFHNHFFLQLVLHKETFNWYRTTWNKLLDVPKFNDPIEQLKYIGKSIEPTIEYENGSAAIEKLTPIIELIKTISISPLLHEVNGFVLDGCMYSLSIGIENLNVTYKWHYLPEEWKILQVIAEKLEEINSELTFI